MMSHEHDAICNFCKEMICHDPILLGPHRRNTTWDLRAFDPRVTLGRRGMATWAEDELRWDARRCNIIYIYTIYIYIKSPWFQRKSLSILESFFQFLKLEFIQFMHLLRPKVDDIFIFLFLKPCREGWVDQTFGDARLPRMPSFTLETWFAR